MVFSPLAVAKAASVLGKTATYENIIQKLIN